MSRKRVVSTGLKSALYPTMASTATATASHPCCTVSARSAAFWSQVWSQGPGWNRPLLAYQCHPVDSEMDVVSTAQTTVGGGPRRTCTRQQQLRSRSAVWSPSGRSTGWYPHPGDAAARRGVHLLSRWPGQAGAAGLLLVSYS